MEWVGRREEEGRGIEKEKTKVDTVFLLSKLVNTSFVLLECCFLYSSSTDFLQAWVPIQKELRGPHKVKRPHKLCDVTKVAACGIVATGRLSRVGEIVLMRSHNFMRST